MARSCRPNAAREAAETFKAAAPRSVDNFAPRHRLQLQDFVTTALLTIPGIGINAAVQVQNRFKSMAHLVATLQETPPEDRCSLLAELKVPSPNDPCVVRRFGPALARKLLLALGIEEAKKLKKPNKSTLPKEKRKKSKRVREAGASPLKKSKRAKGMTAEEKEMQELWDGCE